MNNRTSTPERQPQPQQSSDSARRPPELFLDPEAVRAIGAGGFGRVFRALVIQPNRNPYLAQGKTIAVKVVAPDRNWYTMKDYSRERRALERLMGMRHPNILRYYGELKHDELPSELSNVRRIGTECVGHLLDYAEGGSLRGLANGFQGRPGGVPTSLIRDWVAQLLQALHYLHTSMRMIHRDVKADNVLFKEGCLKLADFGSACRLPEDLEEGEQTDTIGPLQSVSGTTFWTAPEKLIDNIDSPKMDIWSLGMLVWELLDCGVYSRSKGPLWHLRQKYPKELTVVALAREMEKIKSDNDIFASRPDYDPLVVDFVRQCLVRDPKLRPSAWDLMRHPLILFNSDGSSGLHLCVAGGPPAQHSDPNCPKAPQGDKVREEVDATELPICLDLDLTDSNRATVVQWTPRLGCNQLWTIRPVKEMLPVLPKARIEPPQGCSRVLVMVTVANATYCLAEQNGNVCAINLEAIDDVTVEHATWIKQPLHNAGQENEEFALRPAAKIQTKANRQHGLDPVDEDGNSAWVLLWVFPKDSEVDRPVLVTEEEAQVRSAQEKCQYTWTLNRRFLRDAFNPGGSADDQRPLPEIALQRAKASGRRIVIPSHPGCHRSDPGKPSDRVMKRNRRRHHSGAQPLSSDQEHDA